MSMSDELVIYLPGGQVESPTNPYGRLVANAGTYRALARDGGYRSLHFQCLTQPDSEQLTHELRLDDATVQVSVGSPLSTAAAVRSGILLSGQPYLSEPAWVRRHAGRDGDYSIIGTIFAYASATHREQMMHSALAPLHEWDAMICSSPTLRDTVEGAFDHWENYLQERLGVATLPRPQLPVIPFGTNVAEIEVQSNDADARARLRASLDIAEDDVMVYFLGRLSYYDKAFPQAMFKSVEAAQRQSGVTTHFVLTGWFPDPERDRPLFEAAARTYAPSVRVMFLDGNDSQVVAQCWAAADIFLLLSDTILETFGQALTEAMAAGLPLVVSDWDGYRSIVRDEVDGFLIPTLGGPGGVLGETLALAQLLDLVDYSQYGGAVAQHTAVNVASAAAALSRLISSPELRAAMGAAARQRARGLYAWPVVVAQYTELFADLAERRAGAEPVVSSHRMNPLRNDPFVDFRPLPTRVLTDDLSLRLAAGANGGSDLLLPNPLVELDAMFPGLRGNESEVAEVIALLGKAGTLSVGEIVQSFPQSRRAFVRMTVMWLAKAGVVEWLAES
ncbi:MAG: glycosyltransferase family 4 protein [Actinomycetes bacterium]